MPDIFSQRLCVAAEEGDVKTVLKLLKRVATLKINARSYQYGGNALYFAAKGGHIEVVRLLLDAGANPNMGDAIQVTPLHLAAKGDFVDVVELLLVGRANVNAKTKDGLTAIDLAEFESPCWYVLHNAMRGFPPKIIGYQDVVPIIHRHWIPRPVTVELDLGKRKQKNQSKGK